eukprot:Partr_v1_DN28382_c3_g1_i12_m78690 putative ubiquitin-conjugating enzyme
MSEIQQKRLAKEIKQLVMKPTPGITLLDYESMACIVIEMTGAEETIYANEKFRLQFKFSTSYPMEAPEVMFLHPAIPIHPHIYSNGHICLSILYDQWSPALTISSVCLSILSMLSSCKKKELPKDNERYVSSHKGKSPRDTNWWFHDDAV